MFNTVHAEAVRRGLLLEGGRALLDLARLPRPNVKRIANLPCAIALKARRSTSRLSTLASLTGVFPLIRLLYDRLGERVCVNCRNPLQIIEPREVLERMKSVYEGSAVAVLGDPGPVSEAQTAETISAFESRGYTRLFAGGVYYPIEEFSVLKEAEVPSLGLVIDSFRWSARSEARLAEAIRFGLKEFPQIELRIDNELYNLSEPPRCLVCGAIGERLSGSSFDYFRRESGCAECRGFGELPAFEPSVLVGGEGVHPWVRRLLGDAALEEIILNGPVVSPGLIARALCELWLSAGDLRVRQAIERQANLSSCVTCRGARLGPHAACCKLGNLSFAELFCANVTQALEWCNLVSPLIGSRSRADSGVLTRVIDELCSRLRGLQQLGLAYLQLNRSARSLSSGELYRAALAARLSRPHSGLLYLMDEPASGLHARDLERVLQSLRELVASENSVVVVEHHPHIIGSADYLIELGPGGGQEGGRVVAAGRPDELSGGATLTGKILRGEFKQSTSKSSLRSSIFKDASAIRVIGACKHNLKNIDVSLPIAALTAVVGVSGSGKSSLVFDSLALPLSKLIRGLIHGLIHGALSPETVFAQAEVSSIENWRAFSHVVDSRDDLRARSRRSTVATLLGVMPTIRELYAKTIAARVLGLTARHFSFNTAEGWCEQCKGIGSTRLRPATEVLCPHCGGSRFNRQVARVCYRNRSLPDLLSSNISEAASFLEAVLGKESLLKRCVEFGLGYLSLSQNAASLSLGEQQRLRLVTDMFSGRSELLRGPKEKTLFLFDEPCRGLHPTEVSSLLNLFSKLTDQGHTVVVVEHRPDFICAVDYLVELGPGAGADGGEVLYAGPAAEQR